MIGSRFAFAVSVGLLLAGVGTTLALVPGDGTRTDTSPPASPSVDGGAGNRVYPIAGIADAGLREVDALAPVHEMVDSVSLPRDPALTLPTIVVNPIVGLTPAVIVDPHVPYVMGVTWTGGVDVAVDARTKTEGTWGPWERVSNDHPADGEGAPSTNGTEPYIAVGADAVQFRASSETGAPVDLNLRVYSADDPAFSAASDASLSTASLRRARGYSLPQGTTTANSYGGPLTLFSPVANPQPVIHLRAEWEPRAPSGDFDVRTVQGAVVHHTAGSNSYAQGDVPSILRSIQNYHMDGRGWFDIGYNFLVDRFGRIWEGRAGGITNTTAGVHSHSFNSIATGVSIIGDFQSTSVPQAAFDGLVTLLAWKLTLHGVDASGNIYNPLDGTFPAILSHRDVPESSTACPGINLWNRLPDLRAAVEARQNLPALAITRDATGDGVPDVAKLENGIVTIYTPGTRWASVLAVLPPVSPADVPPSPSALVPASVPVVSPPIGGAPWASGPNGWAKIAAAHAGHRAPPARRTGLGVLWTTSLTFAAPDSVSAELVGDINGDGLADLITVEGDGRLLLHLTTETGFASAINVANPLPPVPQPGPVPSPAPSPSPSPSPSASPEPRGWSEYVSIAGAGDVNFDGTPDLVAVDAAGNVIVFPWSTTDPSTLALARTVARGYVGYQVSGTGAWSSTRVSDLIAVGPAGQVVLLEGKGLTAARVVGTVSTGWEPGTRFWPLGAAEPDGSASVIAWSPQTGTFQFFTWTSAKEWTLNAEATTAP